LAVHDCAVKRQATNYLPCRENPICDRWVMSWALGGSAGRKGARYRPADLDKQASAVFGDDDCRRAEAGPTDAPLRAHSRV